MMRRKKFINCNIINPEDGSEALGCTILVNEMGVIEEIINSTESQHTPSESDNVIDIKNRWILPGLSDLHVHVAEEPYKEAINGYSFDEDELTFAFRAAKNLNVALQSGITLLRDVGAFDRRNIRVREIIEKKIYRGPHLLACGNLITFPGGHYSNRGKVIDDINDVRTIIKEELDAGADLIKVINDPIGFNLRELRVIVEECHNLGLRVACHAFTKDGIDLAVDAGFDTIEHGVPTSFESIEKIVKNDITLVPTHICALESANPKIYKEIVEKRDFINSDDLTLFDEWARLQAKWLPEAFKANLKIAVGTDAGFLPFDSAIKEMKTYQNYGATNLQILRAATTTPAEVTGLSTSRGAVKEGRLADFIVVETNPIASLDTIDNVILVCHDGEIFIDRLD